MWELAKLGWLATFAVACSGQVNANDNMSASGDASADGTQVDGGSGADVGTSGNEGGSPAPTVAQAVASGAIAPRGLDIDSEFVYWTDKINGGRLVRCPLDGCEEQGKVLASNLKMPTGVAVDDTSVFFTTGDAIMRVQKDGTALTVLSEKANAPGWIRGDETHIYWTDYLWGAALKCEKSDCTNTLVVLADQQYDAGKIAISETDVFWATQQGVATCPKSGCGSGPNLYPGGGLVLGVAVDGQHVFWSVFGANPIYWCPLGGCSDAERLVLDGGATALLVSAKKLYWGRGTDGAIYGMDRSGVGWPEQVAAGSWRVKDIAADQTALYWTSESGGVVMRVAK